MRLALPLLSFMLLQAAEGSATAMAALRGVTARAPTAAVTGPSALTELAVIAGAVVNAAGRPVAGARVSIVGTATTGTTDRDGRFRLEAGGGAEVVLSVAAIGYRPLTQRVRVGNENLRLTLSELVINLEEVIVTGTTEATQRKQLGNAVATVQVSDELQFAAASNLGQLLNSRAAGVTIQPRMGFVGAGPRLKVRGAGTFYLGSEPIIYVDGIRADGRASSGGSLGGRNSEMVSRLNDFNPEDIESIEIIKGPAAATLYGTEASNGVVQIITKKGRSGKAEFEITSRQGANWFQDPEGRLPVLYSKDKSGNPVTLNILEVENAAGRPFFKTGHAQGYALNLRGGTDLIQYFGSLGWDDDEGVEPTNRANRFSSRLNLTVTPTDKLNINAGLGLTRGRVDIPFSNNIFSMYYAEANLLDTPRRGFFLAPPEVYWRNYQFRQDFRRSTFSLDVTHRTRPWLTQRLRTGLDLTNEDDKNLNKRMSLADGQFFGLAARLGSVRQDRTAVSNRTVDYSLTATMKPAQSLGLTTTFGAQYFRRSLQRVIAQGQEFPAPGVTTVSSAAIRQGFEDFEESATVGLFVQQQVAWKDRVFLTAAVRGDDNSAFGKNYDVVIYPKVGLSWAVSEESFWPKGFAERFRLRAAFGAAGQQPSTFAAVQSYRPVTGGNGASSVSTGSIGNPDLKPERSEELELGFEAAFLKDRIGVDVSYYRKTTADAILLLPVPPSLGYTGFRFSNAGEILTKGLEVALTGQVIDKQNLKWTLGLNFSDNDSEVKSLGGAEFLGTGGLSGFRVGFPVGSYMQRRVVSATKDPAVAGRVRDILCDGGPGKAPMSCADAPRLYMGRMTPKVEGAFTSEWQLFGRLRLYGMVDFKRGHRLWDTDMAVRCRFLPRCRENFYPNEFDAVTLAYIQLSDDAFSEPYLADASFFKLRELSLGYTLPDRLANMVGGRRATITIAGRNLALWTKYTSFDPESYDEHLAPGTSFFGAGDNLRVENSDISTLPQLAQFIATIRIVF
ncbi:MAG: SusC/RagA family TonB-linked outer membrane protein [Gemmatimonadetes bacterium]|nr:SusC/RagA family TonB-linked outer membrane protein [Gemmatimonadota bacterium]